MFINIKRGKDEKFELCKWNWFSICAGTSVKVTKPLSEITSDTRKGYVTFYRPAFVGGAYNNTIVEFNPNTLQTSFVGELESGSKIIYPVNSGVHYFYTTGGENDDMIKVEASNNKMYNIEVQPTFGAFAARFYFKPLKSMTVQYANSFIGQECSSNKLNDDNYQLVEDAVRIDSKATYKHDSLPIELKCEDNKVINVEVSGMNTIKNADLIAPSKKAIDDYKSNVLKYQSEIKEDFESWLKDDSAETAVKAEDGFNL